MRELFTVDSLSPEDTESAGEKLACLIRDNAVTTDKPVFVAMYGELGAGKTAFVRGMAKVLAPDEAVCSPTYSIINLYNGTRRFYHLDLYRIRDDDDLYSVGFYELFDDLSCVIAAEWCENIPFALPDSYIELRIDRICDDNGSETGRRIYAAVH